MIRKNIIVKLSIVMLSVVLLSACGNTTNSETTDTENVSSETTTENITYIEKDAHFEVTDAKYVDNTLVDGEVMDWTTWEKIEETEEIEETEVKENETVSEEMEEPTQPSETQDTPAANINYPAGNYSPGSVYGPKLTQQELNDVAEAVNTFLATYDTASMDDYTKVLTAHDYLCYNVSYAPSWAENRANTAWGALVYGEAQCSGYARAMKALCDAMGVGCYYVHADDYAINPSHQWNTVCVNGNWYIIDVQCNDSSGWYAVFLVSDDTYASMGLSWDRSSVPACPYDYGY